jgi:hypothetical protein
MPATSPNPEYIRSLQLLLHDAPQGSQQETAAILTTAPECWDEYDVGRSLLIDLSTILDCQSPWSSNARRFRSSLVHHVFEGLLRAGWPEHQLHSRYRLDAKNSLHFDIAILDEDSKVVVVIDVDEWPFPEYRTDSWRRDIFARTETLWICETDGTSYNVISACGESQQLARPPAPSDFGLPITGSPPHETSPKTTIVRPSTVDALQAVMDEHSPDRLVIDFSLPWGKRVRNDSAIRSLLTSELSDLRLTDTLAILLAWAASLDSVVTVSAVCPPSIPWASSVGALRTWLQDRLGLAAHIELPSGVFAPMTQIGSSLLLLGGRRPQAYFNAIATVEELVSAQEKLWYTSLTEFLSGGEPRVGFVMDGEGLDSWAIATNHPKVAKIRERIESLGEPNVIGDLFGSSRNRVRG